MSLLFTIFGSDPFALLKVGHGIISLGLEACCYSLLYGTFALLYAQAAMAHLKMKQKTRAQFWMFLISTFTFIAGTVDGCIILVADGLWIDSMFIKHQDLPLLKRSELALQTLKKLNLVASWISVIIVAVNDAIVVWRAFVLLQHKRWPFMTLPLLLLLGVVAASLATLMVHTLGLGLQLVVTMNTVRLGLTLGTNVVGTAIISYIYWHHRRAMRTGLGEHHPTPAEQVLALLVESGIVFCIPQALNFAFGLSFEYGRVYIADYFRVITWSISGAFSAIYPTMVLALVNSHRTLDQVYATSTFLQSGQGANNRSHTLRFALPNISTSNASVLQDAEKDDDIEVGLP